MPLITPVCVCTLTPSSSSSSSTSIPRSCPIHPHPPCSPTSCPCPLYGFCPAHLPLTGHAPAWVPRDEARAFAYRVVRSGAVYFAFPPAHRGPMDGTAASCKWHRMGGETAGPQQQDHGSAEAEAEAEATDTAVVSTAVYRNGEICAGEIRRYEVDVGEGEKAKTADVCVGEDGVDFQDERTAGGERDRLLFDLEVEVASDEEENGGWSHRRRGRRG